MSTSTLLLGRIVQVCLGSTSQHSGQLRWPPAIWSLVEVNPMLDENVSVAIESSLLLV